MQIHKCKCDCCGKEFEYTDQNPPDTLTIPVGISQDADTNELYLEVNVVEVCPDCFDEYVYLLASINKDLERESKPKEV